MKRRYKRNKIMYDKMYSEILKRNRYLVVSHLFKFCFCFYVLCLIFFDKDCLYEFLGLYASQQQDNYVLIQSLSTKDFIKRILFLPVDSDSDEDNIVKYSVDDLIKQNLNNKYIRLLFEKSLSNRQNYWRGAYAIPGVSVSEATYVLDSEQIRSYSSVILQKKLQGQFFDNYRLRKAQSFYELIDKKTLGDNPEETLNILKDAGRVEIDQQALYPTAFLVSVLLPTGVMIPLFVCYVMDLESVWSIEHRVFPHLLESGLDGNLAKTIQRMLECRVNRCNGNEKEDVLSYFENASEVHYNITRFNFNVGFEFKKLGDKSFMPYEIDTVALVNPVVTDEVFIVDPSIINDEEKFKEVVTKYIKYFTVKYGFFYKGVDLLRLDTYFLSVFYCRYPEFEILWAVKVN